MKLNCFLSIILGVALCASKTVIAQEVGSYVAVWQDKDVKKYTLKLKKNKTYIRKYFSLHGNPTKGGVEKGTYEKRGDTLILNSNKKPNYYNLIKVEEFIIPKSDSVVVELLDENGASGAGFAQAVCINGKNIYNEYFLNNKFTYKVSFVDYIIIGYYGSFDYPVVIPKNRNSNYFKITLIDRFNKNNNKRMNRIQYLHNEILIYKDDALYYNFDEDGWNEKYIKMKSK